jgi:hypothetical protein
LCPASRATPLVPSPGAARGDRDSAARHPYPISEFGLKHQTDKSQNYPLAYKPSNAFDHGILSPNEAG